jgi:hypothetical protein
MNDTANEKVNDNAPPDGAKTEGVKKGPPQFDWVTQRSACTLPKVFAALRQQVEADVKTRNDLRPNYAPYEFSLTENIEQFAVILKAKDVSRSVTFRLADNAISVHDDKDAPIFQVTIAFNDRGECKLYVNEQERESWQIRRMALENLLF